MSTNNPAHSYTLKPNGAMCMFRALRAHVSVVTPYLFIPLLLKFPVPSVSRARFSRASLASHAPETNVFRRGANFTSRAHAKVRAAANFGETNFYSQVCLMPVLWRKKVFFPPPRIRDKSKVDCLPSELETRFAVECQV